MDQPTKTVKLNPSRVALEKGKTYKFCGCDFGEVNKKQFFKKN